MFPRARSILAVGFLAGCIPSAFAGSYNLTRINLPQAYVNSQALGINDAGQIILTDYVRNNNIGLLDTGGVFTPIIDPLAINTNDPFGGSGTYLTGINDAGQIVGHFTGTDGTNGFLYSGGSFSTISDPLATNGTYAIGINNSGQIVGEYYDSTGPRGFLYSGGTYTTLGVAPDGAGFVPVGINDAGQMVGRGASNIAGYLYSGGVFSTISNPLAVYSNYLTGINDAGEIVGEYRDRDNFGGHGMLYSRGIFTTIDYTSSVIQGLTGINNRGQAVGYFSQGENFVATPAVSSPEPTTLVITPAAFLAIGVWRTRKRLRASRAER